MPLLQFHPLTALDLPGPPEQGLGLTSPMKWTELCKLSVDPEACKSHLHARPPSLVKKERPVAPSWREKGHMPRNDSMNLAIQETIQSMEHISRRGKFSVTCCLGRLGPEVGDYQPSKECSLTSHTQKSKCKLITCAITAAP